MSDVMRKSYRELADSEKAAIAEVKELAQSLHSRLDSFGSSREISLAKTKVEEAVMWATKHLTA